MTATGRAAIRLPRRRAATTSSPTATATAGSGTSRPASGRRSARSVRASVTATPRDAMRYAILFGALAVLVLASSVTLSGGRVAPAPGTPEVTGSPPAPARPLRPPAADDVTPAI